MNANTEHDDLLATPNEVASYLRTTQPRLAQMRHLGIGPRFVKVGRSVLYRWADIHAYLDANTHETGTGSETRRDTPTA